MATRRQFQSQGIGSSLLNAGFDHWRDLADIVWANARDAALPFYANHGFSVRGPGFIESVTELPHHVVVRELGPRTR
jgi:GNAT superfamily N-acetyltransferase